MFSLFYASLEGHLLAEAGATQAHRIIIGLGGSFLRRPTRTSDHHWLNGAAHNALQMQSVIGQTLAG